LERALREDLSTKFFITRQGKSIEVEAPNEAAARAMMSDVRSEQTSLVHYDRNSDSFSGSMVLMVKLAMQAVQDLGWKIEQVNETVGLITFETARMSWGSWSGVSCSLNITEITPGTFRVSGTGKQNIRGGQLLSFELFGEAQGKARKAINKMKELAEPGWGTINTPQARSQARLFLFLMAILGGMWLIAQIGGRTPATTPVATAPATTAAEIERATAEKIERAAAEIQRAEQTTPTRKGAPTTAVPRTAAPSPPAKFWISPQ
jgi:hypothetical protein